MIDFDGSDPVDEVAAAIGAAGTYDPTRPRIHPDLTEILAACGPAPTVPVFYGNLAAHGRAVREYERLVATPAARARLASVQDYFARKEASRKAWQKELADGDDLNSAR